MTQSAYTFTSESVSEGHPDKICDQISDAILDSCLKDDPGSRVACETLVKNRVVVLAGEITTSASLDYDAIVRRTISEIGYTDPEIGFDSDSCEIMTFVNEQSADISQGVSEGEGTHKEQGAGDQGIMFGFACNETAELMPLPIALSHQLVKELADQRKSGAVNFLRPDSKSQVSVRYENSKPVGVDAVVLSTQHTDEASLKQIEEYIIENVVKKVIPSELLSANTQYYINPTGRFVIGGPVGDAGLTGRKIIVDTYGGYSRHGGGAFSGKDASKVDRSAAYAARNMARNVVQAKIADRCEVQLAYAIGVAQPVAIYVDTFGTGKAPEDQIGKVLQEMFNLTPAGIIDTFELRRPIFQTTAAYGHFGRKATDEGHFSWETARQIDELAGALLK